MGKSTREVGKHLDKAARDQSLIRHCRSAVTMAGTLRKSGRPEHAMTILSGTLPVQLELVQKGLVGRKESGGCAGMIESLRTAGKLSPEQFSIIREGLKAVGHGSGRDIHAAIDAGLTLHRILCSQAYVEAVQAKDTPPPQAKSPAWQRWATAAASLFMMGGGASNAT
ncbi:hypothetical protein [Rhodopirellula europaea]|uniref:hypothetical protein n=1 Tax=Rhodopirellula europaea TaxID=1263866 RepID=UPI003D2739BB|tara:strand:- start:5843 stop:6346 length:504 start_codon:yes stop_codon:yes gene_type:complete